MFDYLSDLHIDYNGFNYEKFKLSVKSKNLIIAGDICDGFNYTKITSELEFIASLYKNVLFVPGNHDYYGYNTKHKFILPDNFIQLNNEIINIDGFNIYGGTMWSSFENCDICDIIPSLVQCFAHIKDLSIDKSIQLYNEFFDELITQEITSHIDLVITHFAPSHLSNQNCFKSSPLSPYFCNNLDEFIKTSNIKTWIHGHCHNILVFPII